MAARAAKMLLRKEIKKRIATLSDEEKMRQSEVLLNKLLKSREFQNSQRISVFLNMHDEIRTENILHNMLRLNKDCFIPCYEGSSMDMVRVQSMDDYNQLPETAWKIKQPLRWDDRENAMDSGLDLILMPGLAFTSTGDRLGRGKGYYDTYLEKYKNKFGQYPLTLALAFREQIVPSVPTSEHDVPLDLVFYEEERSET